MADTLGGRELSQILQGCTINNFEIEYIQVFTPEYFIFILRNLLFWFYSCKVVNSARWVMQITNINTSSLSIYVASILKVFKHFNSLGF